MKNFNEYMADFRSVELGKTPIVVAFAQAGIRLPKKAQQELTTGLGRYEWIDDIIVSMLDLLDEPGGLAALRRLKNRLAREEEKGREPEQEPEEEFGRREMPRERDIADLFGHPGRG